MKKFVVLLVVVAMTCISSMAFAASEVAVSGSLEIRGRNLDNLDLTDNAIDTTGGTLHAGEGPRQCRCQDRRYQGQDLDRKRLGHLGPF